jgi:hypothetical protein
MRPKWSKTELVVELVVHNDERSIGGNSGGALLPNIVLVSAFPACYPRLAILNVLSQF